MSNTHQILYILSALAASQKAMHYAQKFNTAVAFYETDNQLHFNANTSFINSSRRRSKKDR